jgi:peroxiredoxin
MIHLLVSSAAVLGLSAAGLSIGDKAPMTDVKMKNVDGKELTISAAGKDKGTLVFFTCNHCPYVKAWEDRIVALGNAYGKKGIGVIAINPNDPSDHSEDNFETMVERAKAEKMEFPYVVDATSKIARAFGATKTPEAFLFDKSGKLVYHGTIDDNSSDATKVKDRFLQEALDALLAGRPIARPETKALGCSIKFRPES